MLGRPLNSIILKCELVNQNGEVIGQGVGARFVEQQDKGDLNKALKMAAKSAMIDATLRCAGLSEIFTQDIEDMTNLSKPERSTSSHNGKPTEKQIKAIKDLLDNPAVNTDEKGKLSELLSNGISKAKAKEVLDYFYGKSELIEGDWVKMTVGVIDQRRFD